MLRPAALRQVAARRARVSRHQASAPLPSHCTRVACPLLMQHQRPSPTTAPSACPARGRYSSSSSSSSASSSSAPVGASPPPPPETLYGYFPQTLPLGPPPAGPFAVDARPLRREFLALQAAHHPDKQPPGLKAAAEARSAAINHAYRTLADPLLRAQYLLARRGVDVAADEDLRVGDAAAAPADDDARADRELLLSVMESHEAIEEAEHPSHLDGLRAENDARVAVCHEDLARAFADDDVDAAKRLAIRLRYWVNIRNAIHDWEEGKPPVLIH